VRARHPTTLAKVILHPSKVIELQMKKPGFVCKSGQYIFINCPDVSLFQWHPFTMTNAPEEGFVSVHMRITGDWTGDMAKRLGVKFGKNDAVERLQIADLPRVLIDGPYGTASEDLFTYEVAVCVGAGIGQTPFASLLKSIWY
jgi:predicted ferric reductase